MAWEITPEELLVRYDDGERNFAGIKLIYSYGAPAHYAGIDLKGIVLRDINLRGAYFEQAILAQTKFQGADITARSICSRWNLIWKTTMPDGTVVEGPQWGNGRDAK